MTWPVRAGRGMRTAAGEGGTVSGFILFHFPRRLFCAPENTPFQRMRNDCKYCPLRSGTNVRRSTLKPEEVANVFMEYQRRKKVFGLFLSSAVINSPDYTMDRINNVARLLRYTHNFKGYIHLKIIPGHQTQPLRLVIPRKRGLAQYRDTGQKAL